MVGTFILVGYDGSQESVAALRWAADEARLRRLAITVCHAWHWPYPVQPSGPSALATARRMAEHLADAGAALVRDIAPQLTVCARAMSGPPAETLLAMSSGAEAIVVGHRGGGGFADLPVGSVAGQVAEHAAHPVIVVRGALDTGRVVAGVDGSAASDPVLAFALEEAALRRVQARVICSWWDPSTVPVTPVIETDELRRRAAARFERLVAPWCEKFPYVEVRTSFVMEPPRPALLAAAEGASMLVVGRRGHGDDPGPLGSVGQAMVHRAPCPVAVIGG